MTGEGFRRQADRATTSATAIFSPLEGLMTYEQLKMRTTAEAGGALAVAADIDRDGVALGERATITPLNDAQAQLVEALAGFDQLGMGGSPQHYLRKKPKPLNKSERNAAALAAAAVAEAAETVERIARHKLDAATTGMGDLIELMINAKIIQSLMLEIVRTLMRSISAADSPIAIAALVFHAKYLAGMFTTPHGAGLLDHEYKTRSHWVGATRRRTHRAA
jgi:hypothetical protein